MKLLVFSDIHSDLKRLEQLIETEADYYFAAGDLVSWARGLNKAGEILRRKAGQVYVIPGNHESPADITAFCAEFGFHDFHGETTILDGVHIAGLGCSAHTPFQTPGEYSEAQFEAKLAPFAGLDPLVLICHSPPKSTLLDKAGPGLHFGSAAVGDFIAANQPKYFFCGHIHEAEGVVEMLGSTTAVNVGKKGYLLDLDKLKV